MAVAMKMQSRCEVLENANDKNARQKETKLSIHYRAIATTTAPPTMATTSRAIPVVSAAAPVCRPGLAPVVAAALPVATGVMTVIEVIVLRLPSGMVVVLL